MRPRPDFPAAGRLLSRRRFIRCAATAMLAAPALAQRSSFPAQEPLLDIHQHILYLGRLDEILVAHQRAMGATLTVLMPSGDRGPGHTGGSNEAAGVQALAKRYPDEFVFFANEISNHPNVIPSIERQLKAGAIGIGEQKFLVDCDSIHMQTVAEIARAHSVPILMHFSERLNAHIERFHRMLEKYPDVTFIGHAGTWWAHIDKNASSSGPVSPGGLIDRYLSDYPNCYADISANSARNAFYRDEAHAKDFFERHQDKLIFGSDCRQPAGHPECIDARTIDIVRRLGSREVQRKIFWENGRRVLKLA